MLLRPTLPTLLTLFVLGVLVPALSTCVRAQNLGLHPPSIDWQKLSTPEANILYPLGYEARAQRIAQLMHAMRTNHSTTVGSKYRRFDLVLQTFNTSVNGYVGLAPFRSELYLTPPQQANLISGADWADLLTIHEFRHVQQTANERRGITYLWSLLFGQIGWAGAANLAIPNWYSEGDAVIMETALTPTGRGQTPAFSATLRALELAGKRYSYARSRNNSYRRLIPNHYQYGYNTIAYARERFGHDVWTDVLHQGAAYRYIFYPFSQALKRATGRNTRRMYREALADLREKQDSSLAARGALVAGTAISEKYRAVTDFRYPIIYNGRLFALRSGYQDLPDLVEINIENGQETIITSISIQREPYVDVRGGLATWMEDRNHPRYTNLGYSDIVVYNLETGRRKRLTHRRRYLSPSPSPDGSRIVAVELKVLEGQTNLALLDAATGEVQSHIPVPANSAALPKFSPDGQTIYYYERTDAGTAIVAVGQNGQRRRVLKPPSFEPLGNLQVTAGGMLVYSSGRDGIDNVYRLDPASGDVERLTNVPIGAEFPFVQRDTLLYTEATPRGYRLRRLVNKRVGEPDFSEALPPARPNVFQRPAAWEAEAADLGTVVSGAEYPAQNVNDGTYGLRLHSWGVGGSTTQPGVLVAATNALQTIEVAASVGYNYNEERPVAELSARYGGWFPVLGMSVTREERKYEWVKVDAEGPRVNTSNRDQYTLGGMLSIPLGWTAGEYFMNASVAGDFRHYWMRGSSGIIDADFSGFGASVSFSALKRRARSQVQSRLGVWAMLKHQSAPDDDIAARQSLAQARIYLPGVSKTHSLRFGLDYSTQDVFSQFPFTDTHPYARGFAAYLTENAVRLSANYELPLLYPEVGVLGIYYLSRIRLNGFYDYGKIKLPFFGDITRNSAGVELYLDQTLFNVAPISFGIRRSFRVSNDGFAEDKIDQWQIIIGSQF